jgi:hypothetical protein
MNGRRKLALLLAAAVRSFVPMIPALMSAPKLDDPLAPIGLLASQDAPSLVDVALMLPLRREASAVLSDLQAPTSHR